MKKIIYPYIPKGKKIKYVEADNRFMVEARLARNTMGTEKAHPTGAVVVKNNKIIGKAANLAGFSQPFLIKLHQKGLCIRRILRVKSGEKYWLCPGCATNKKHAETLAISDALKKVGPKQTKGADMYLYGHWWCCEPCWDAIIKAKLDNIYLLKNSETLFNPYNHNNTIKQP